MRLRILGNITQGSRIGEYEALICKYRLLQYKGCLIFSKLGALSSFLEQALFFYSDSRQEVNFNGSLSGAC